MKPKIYNRLLITLVKKYPEIWQESEDDYIIRLQRKRKAWEAIAKELGFTDDKVRINWTNLRSKYKKNLIWELENGTTPKWQYFADMDFMRNVVLFNASKETDFTNNTDSELETSELSQHEAMEQRTEIDEHQFIAEPSMSTYRPKISSTARELQPIVLSTQWKNQEKNNKQTFSPRPSETFQSLISKSLGEKRQAGNSAKQSETIPTAGDTKSWRAYSTTAFDCLESHPSNLQSQRPTSPECEEELTEDTIDLTDVMDIKPTQIVKALPPFPTPSLKSKSSKVKEYFQEPDFSTSTSKRPFGAIEESAEKRSAVSPRQKRIKNAENPSEVEFQDEDYYFVMSLMPSLRKIPHNKKFGLRIDIMNLIGKDLQGV